MGMLFTGTYDYAGDSASDIASDSASDIASDSASDIASDSASYSTNESTINSINNSTNGTINDSADEFEDNLAKSSESDYSMDSEGHAAFTYGDTQVNLTDAQKKRLVSLRAPRMAELLLLHPEFPQDVQKFIECLTSDIVLQQIDDTPATSGIWHQFLIEIEEVFVDFFSGEEMPQLDD
ncbi:hypothetical protein BGZ54_007128 [Gamsiella multidivaricata]|nr:hypothetical protein BGZ54_007128 [Gamsiella multidivaricata]